MQDNGHYLTVDSALTRAEELLASEDFASAENMAAHALRSHTAVSPAKEDRISHVRTEARILLAISRCRRRSDYQAGFDLMRDICNLYTSIGRADEAVDILRSEAQVIEKCGDTEIVSSYYALLLQILTELDDRKSLTQIHLKAGNFVFNRGRYPESRVHYEAALELARDNRFDRLEADAHLNIGNVHWACGDYDDALQCYLLAEEHYSRLGEMRARSDVYNNVGAIYLYQGEYALVLEYFLKALGIRQEAGDWKRVAGSLMNIGNVYFHLGHEASAFEYYLQSKNLYEQHDDRPGMAELLVNIGAVYERTNNRELALQAYHKSVELRRDCGLEALLATTLINIAIVYTNSGDYQSAIEHAQLALVKAQENEDLRVQSYAINCLGEAKMKNGERQAAREHLEQALEIRRRLGYRSGEAETLNAIAELEMMEDDPESALATIEEALTSARELNEKPRELELLLKSARCHEQCGQLREALDDHHKANELRAQIERDKNSQLLTNLQVVHQVEDLRRNKDGAHRRVQALEQQIGALETLQHALQVREQDRSESLRVISHDLRKSLTSIGAALRRQPESMETGRAPAAGRENQHVAESIQQAGKVVARLEELLIPSVATGDNDLDESGQIDTKQKKS